MNNFFNQRRYAQYVYKDGEGSDKEIKQLWLTNYQFVNGDWIETRCLCKRCFFYNAQDNGWFFVERMATINSICDRYNLSCIPGLLPITKILIQYLKYELAKPPSFKKICVDYCVRNQITSHEIPLTLQEDIVKKGISID